MMNQAQPYLIVNMQLAQIQKLSPTMTRFTFQSEELAQIVSYAPDQRVKLFFPVSDHSAQTHWIENSPEWYQYYRQLPEQIRPPMRTYTIRYLRPQQKQVDIDFAMHGATGPASSWAEQAKVGDRVQMAAPNAIWQGDQAGFEWQPPQQADQILLMADETALPAVSGIIDELIQQNTQAHVKVYIEMPSALDRVTFNEHPNIQIHWFSRDDGQQPGRKLIETVHQLFQPQKQQQVELDDINIDEEILWFTKNEQQAQQTFYAWVAAESAAVLAIRRFLIQDCGIDKNCLNFMGYWRKGKVFD
ncbi:siderophore-interacting protein [Acinetobacter sp. S40]|uniref:siderophore-interacting protein n=1 Tax=Acinetobacter sp. S40 TaxID=2767434 RepID=UPI001D0F2BE7|nr:siderophore-interacting protein [Acinetobacter sp. S40]